MYYIKKYTIKANNNSIKNELLITYTPAYVIKLHKPEMCCLIQRCVIDCLLTSYHTYS
jgi:hypothetical protein